MAKRSNNSDAKISKKENAQAADIHLAAKSLAGESYERGYPPTMKHNINRNQTVKGRKGSK